MITINENPKAFRNWDSAVVRIYEILRALNAGGGGGGLFGSTYFVAPEGEDDTAAVGSLSNPWKTISAARNQAVVDGLATSLIYVFPGVYDETELQYDGGNIYLEAGVLIQPRARINGAGASMVAVNVGEKKFTFAGNWAVYLLPGEQFQVVGGANDGKYTIVSAVDNGPNVDVFVAEVVPSASVAGYLRNTRAVFVVGFDPIYAPITSQADSFKVFGEGSINIVDTVDNDWSGGVINIGADGDAYLEGVDYRQQQGVMIYAEDEAKLTVNVSTLEVYGTGGYCITARDKSDTSINADRLISNGSWAFYIRQGVDPTFTGQCVITANRITQTTNFQPLAVQNMSAGRVLINCPIVESENYSLNFNAISGGSITFNGNIIATTGTGNGLIGQNMSGGEIIVNGNIEVEDGRTLQVLGGMTGGEIYINGDQKVVNGNDVEAIVITGTSCVYRFNGRITNTNGGALCTGILKNGGDCVIDTVTIISDSDSIDASTAQNIIVNHSLAANQALDANITNIVTGSLVTIDANVK